MENYLKERSIIWGYIAEINKNLTEDNMNNSIISSFTVSYCLDDLSKRNLLFYENIAYKTLKSRFNSIVNKDNYQWKSK